MDLSWRSLLLTPVREVTKNGKSGISRGFKMGGTVKKISNCKFILRSQLPDEVLPNFSPVHLPLGSF
jgi:hypothetical protein